MVFGKRRDTTAQRTLVRANLLQTCYGETGVMDFGLNRITRERETDERTFSKNVEVVELRNSCDPYDTLTLPVSDV